MDIGSDVANVATRIGADVSKEAMKMSNETMKQFLLYLIEKAKEDANKAGEISLKKLRESNEEIKLFDIQGKEQLKAFAEEAKFYEITFAVLEEENDSFTVLYKSSEEARLKRILKNLIEKSIEGNEEIASELNEIDADVEKPKGKENVISGQLLEHGKAPYEHDPQNEKSYYAKVLTDEGERTIWGVDLERAIKESEVEVGDQVDFENRGRQPVTVMKKERDEEGNVVGQTEIQTHRNTWDAKPSLADKRKEIEPMLNGQKASVQGKSKEREGR